MLREQFHIFSHFWVLFIPKRNFPKNGVVDLQFSEKLEKFSANPEKLKNLSKIKTFWLRSVNDTESFTRPIKLAHVPRTKASIPETEQHFYLQRREDHNSFFLSFSGIFQTIIQVFVMPLSFNQYLEHVNTIVQSSSHSSRLPQSFIKIQQNGRQNLLSLETVKTTLERLGNVC